MMKIASTTSVLFRYSLQDAIDIVAEAGYDGIDIWGGRPHVYRHDYSPGELRSIRQMLKDHGLAVPSLMPAFYRYPYSLSNPNPIVRQDSIDYMRQCLDNAVILGAELLLIVPDHSLYGQTRDDSLQRIIDSIDEVSQYAVQYDIKLGIEVVSNENSDIINTPDHALSIIDLLGYENLGVIMDTDALNLTKETPGGFTSKLGDRLLQIHVSDNDGFHQQNLFPGEGTYDFKGLIHVLKEKGYSGFLTAELSKNYGVDPAPSLRMTADHLRAWMQ